MKLAAVLTSGLLLVAQAAFGQGSDEPMIRVGGFELLAAGAERPVGVYLGADSTAVGKTTVGLFSVSGCRAFALTVPPSQFDANAEIGWRVEATPVRIVEHAVTFRLRWTRTVGVNSHLGAADGDTEITLKPGESRPIDSVPVSPGLTASGAPCRVTAHALRVSAEFGDLEPRLFSADLWLVDSQRAKAGTTQLQTVRGLPHRAVPFYFDGVTDGNDRVDVFGTLLAEGEPDGVAVAIEVIQARTHPGDKGYHAARWFRSTVHLKGDETVEVALPPGDPSETVAPVGARTLAVRIRARQLR